MVFLYLKIAKMGLKCVYLIGTNLTISFLLYKNSNSGCRRGKKQNEKIITILYYICRIFVIYNI